jgi:hypothetical protein
MRGYRLYAYALYGFVSMKFSPKRFAFVGLFAHGDTARHLQASFAKGCSFRTDTARGRCPFATVALRFAGGRCGQAQRNFPAILSRCRSLLSHRQQAYNTPAFFPSDCSPTAFHPAPSPDGRHGLGTAALQALTSTASTCTTNTLRLYSELVRAVLRPTPPRALSSPVVPLSLPAMKSRSSLPGRKTQAFSATPSARMVSLGFALTLRIVPTHLSSYAYALCRQHLPLRTTLPLPPIASFIALQLLALR